MALWDKLRGNVTSILEHGHNLSRLVGPCHDLTAWKSPNGKHQAVGPICYHKDSFHIIRTVPYFGSVLQDRRSGQLRLL